MKNKFLMLCGIALAILQGCAAVSTFTTAARPGDTVALATGWNQSVSSRNISAQFVDANGVVTTYGVGDDRFRTATLLYPDLVSNLVVGTETGQNIGGQMNVGVGQYIYQNSTLNDPDWNQTVVYLDLPTTLAVGITNITLTGPLGNLTANPIKVNVISGSGKPNQFNTSFGVSAGNFLESLERHNYYTISFTGPSIPDSIQVDMTRTAGVGVPWVTQTRGDLKNLSWSDDGTSSMRVILSTNHGVPLKDIKGFKFYVAGGVAGVSVTNWVAYDAAGSPISGITPIVNFTQ